MNLNSLLNCTLSFLAEIN